jgi:hypothetical protein
MTGRVATPNLVLRQLAQQIAGSLTSEDVRTIALLYAPRVQGLGADSSGDSDVLRSAWLLLATWLTAYSLGQLTSSDTLQSAFEWFMQDRGVRQVALPLSRLETFAEVLDPEDCAALLPYLLDPLAQGTRRALLRSTDEAPDRLQRKQQGVFYTPADVAQYMATRVGNCLPPGRVTVLDPAAGSGVFLRSAMSSLAFGREVRLFGLDLNAEAADFTSFVLLVAGGWSGWPSPWALWHCHRIDQATTDSLLIRGLVRPNGEMAAHRLLRHRANVRDSLRAGEDPQRGGPSSAPEFVADAFPELGSGADVILSNPPYASVGSHPSASDLGKRFLSGGGSVVSANANMFPLFVEQSSRLLNPRGVLAVVVPLSVTFGTTSQVCRLRQVMTDWPASLEFISFDRTPDALFGDDVKTRNTVIIARRGPDRSVRTTGLLRWTSRTRRDLFQSIITTEVSRDIAGLVPKVSTTQHYAIYQAARRNPDHLAGWVIDWSRHKPDVEVSAQQHCVYLAPTAYNWLNVLVDISALSRLGHTSEGFYQAVSICSEMHRFAAYSVLASRVVYLLWRIEGDGFHVTRSFAERIPVPSTQDDIASLATLGEALWEQAKTRPIISVNCGRRSVALPPCSMEQVSKIDELLIRSLGLPRDVDVAAWHEQNVIVDLGDERRRSIFETRRH